MLGQKQTVEVVSKFFSECAKFWEREGKEQHEALKLAYEDVDSITTDPYYPNGEELDPEAHALTLRAIKEVLAI